MIASLICRVLSTLGIAKNAGESDLQKVGVPADCYGPFSVACSLEATRKLCESIHQKIQQGGHALDEGVLFP
jgi:invasion protein IalB